jgi:DNA adenine methylase
MFSIPDRARPVIKWAGGKSALLESLIPLFPRKFVRYFEPFLGGAAVFLALDGSAPAFVNDRNPEIYSLYRVIRDEPSALIRLLGRYRDRYSEDFYYRLRSQAPRSPVWAAARTVFLNKTGYNGLFRQNARGGFNVPFGKRASCPCLFERENLLAVSARLRRTRLTNWDFEKVIDRAGPGDFVYCDPPYEPLNVTSSFNSYLAGGFSREEQIRLKRAAERAAARGAVVAISNSAAPFILELYEGWQVHSIYARRSINSKATSRGAIREVLAVFGRPASRRTGSPRSVAQIVEY